jgi:FkbH-like protein
MNLPWLRKTPGDFSEQCKKLAAAGSNLGASIQALASYDLDENQLYRLTKLIKKLGKDGASLTPLAPFRLGILSNSTFDLIEPALIATAARHGILLECIRSDYGQVMQEALSPASAVNASNPDAVLVAIDYRAFPLQARAGIKDDADRAVESSLAYLESLRSGIAANAKAACILQTLAPPPERLFGSLDCSLPGTLQNVIARVNAGMALNGGILLDVAGLASSVGLNNWHSPQQWNLAKLPFASAYVPLYADHVARVIAALRGKSRKCLVLDLDNTLWGGVIGDDGLDGIKLAQGDATGEAYLAVQQLALDLRSRGVVLAVSSKNNDDVARLPFRSHPEMLLREEHIAVFQANWNDKATNIKAIAAELSLGTDSMVLLDDNPVERDLVRQFLPQVAVPELPDDPALYARTLAAAGYFESVAFSEEDLKRAGFYQDNARRVGLQKQAGDLDTYLASLNMEITFQPFDATGRARIAQLINKSNQFNLTTRRYTEAEVALAEADPACFTLQVRLVDSFGDNGMISVVICRQTDAATWEFDTWLMSCRVLGRRVQNAVLRQVLEHAESRGITRLVGVYRPTEKNKLVEDHYASLGFSETGRDPDGSTHWELIVKDAKVQAAPMLVRQIGFDAVVEA